MNLLNVKELFLNHFEDCELKATSNIIVGKIHNFDVQLSQVVANGFKVNNVLHILVNRNITREDIDVIKCIKFKGLYDYISVDVISIKLLELDSKKEEEQDSLFSKLDELFNVFNELALTPCKKCHICGNEIEDNKILCFRQSSVFGGVIGISHEECLNKTIELEKKQILDNDKNTKKIPLAVALCLLVSILFSGLAFILSWKVNYFFELIFYALIPILSVIYLLSKAPNRKYQLVILFVSALIGYIAYSLLYTFIVEFNIGNIGFGLLFLMIGSITTIKSILINTNDKKLEKFEDEKKDE